MRQVVKPGSKVCRLDGDGAVAHLTAETTENKMLERIAVRMSDVPCRIALKLLESRKGNQLSRGAFVVPTAVRLVGEFVVGVRDAREGVDALANTHIVVGPDLARHPTKL